MILIMTLNSWQRQGQLTFDKFIKREGSARRAQ